MTVFLSSHLLAEVEQVATHLAIISQGRLKFEGTPAELQQRSKPRTVVMVDQPERAHALLTGIGCASIREEGRILIAPDARYAPARINSILVQAGIAVSYLATQQLTLEDLFLELTGLRAPENEYAIQ